jgi:menaquinol-cytochrome c reductase iron-sulfur subunit
LFGSITPESVLSPDHAKTPTTTKAEKYDCRLLWKARIKTCISDRFFPISRSNMSGREHPIGANENVAMDESLSRRSFLGVLLGFGTVVMGAALSVPLIRFALHPLLTKTTEIGWSDVGNINEFASLTVPMKKLIRVQQLDAWRKIVSEKAIYVLPMKGGLPRILSPICPHLGCSIPWNETKEEFICPCHGAVFAKNGSTLSGPAPRAMDELESKVENGMLKVRYQYFRQLIPTREALS